MAKLQLSPDATSEIQQCAVTSIDWTLGGEYDTLGRMATAVEKCIFCDIINHRSVATRVYETDQVLAFLDISPVTPGHLLVVPKKHATSLGDMDAETGAVVFRVAHLLARCLPHSGLRCDGVNMFLADGAAAFQEVFHIHLHVFPRFSGDEFAISANWQRRTPEELEGIGVRIRSGLDVLESFE